MTRQEGQGPGYRVPEHIVRAIRRLAREGRPISEIARAVGVSRPTVRASLIVRTDAEPGDGEAEGE